MSYRLFTFIVFIGVAVLSFGLMPHTGWAEDYELMVDPVQVEPEPTRTAVSAGLGVAMTPDYEGSEDMRAVPVPYLTAQFANGMSIQWIASQIRADLIPSGKWMAGPVIQYIGERDDVESDKVDNLDKIDAAVMAGVFAGVSIERFTLILETMADITDENDGTIARFRANYRLLSQDVWKANVNLFTTWASDDYMETYFGITPANAAKSGLRAYSADSGFKDVGVALPVIYSPWQKWSVMGALVYKRLLEDAVDSPVVDDEGSKNQIIAGILGIYRF